MTPEPWQYILLVLASYRLTRLIVDDAITRPLRRALTGRDEDAGGIGAPVIGRYSAWRDELFHCPWCVGMWVSIVTAVTWWIAPSAALAIALPLSLSAIIGLVSVTASRIER